ncbi:DUF488 domain-containing protein [Christiangramia forsetii]|uniref:Protein containing DUF488 n=2 Tax=Christiangramia forsetii TaxID=411153 RepID=A0LZA4_CHRFK|nr:DUF488 family protein [Christiangramia forsetii]GGG37860.1 hypothetical protein GCM10011532_21920 [Christiangramia forsetii]CAL65699.1 protein containing DUF488 [Christiangramia forsetii KT0803]
MKSIRIKRIYEEAYDQDGHRILIDRLWPRGVSKEDAKLDDWNKDIAPSEELRKWFDHDPDKFEEFSKRYKDELKDKKDKVKAIREIAEEHRLSLLYAARDKEHNHAIVLKNVLESKK